MLTQAFILLFAFIGLVWASGQAISRLMRISRHLGVSEFAISFVVVGVAAVLPELFIGINSALSGVPSFGLGIILGANVADLTLVIGLLALVSGGIRLRASTLHQAPWLVLAALLPVLLLADGELSRADGVYLIGGFLIYLWQLYNNPATRRKTAPSHQRADVALDLTIALGCVGLMLLAGHLITLSAENLAVGLSLPIFFIGILLAVGTCLPELIFSIHAARQGHAEMGLGDILGNVLADCMGTIGVIALIHPICPDSPHLVLFSGAFMVLALGLVLLTALTTRRMSRAHGLFFVLLYVLFLVLQVLVENLAVPV